MCPYLTLTSNHRVDGRHVKCSSRASGREGSGTTEEFTVDVVWLR